MPAAIVIGAQWGDEGKGKITDHIAERADMVVRYQGGNNAGHTVILGDTVLKLHQVPSGITRPHVAVVLGHGMVINPPALVEEIDTLRELGVTSENIHISGNAHVVMPYHILLDGLEEELRGDQALGTTRRGIGPAYTDKYARTGIRMQDLVDPARFHARVTQALKRVNLELTRVFDHAPLTVESIEEQYLPAAHRLKRYVEDTDNLVQRALDEGKRLVLEGAQATMLDIDYGTYPFVTSSSPTAGGACQGSGVSPKQITNVLGVVKAYTSRVGAGPFPTEQLGAAGDWLVEQGHEYGTTTGRRRRCGWLDTVALRYAARVNGFTGLAITRLDVLTGLEQIQVCSAYRLPDGTVTRDLPCDSELLARVEPIYEALPGWQEPISQVRSIADLPPAAWAYCQRMSELINVPIDLVSVGAERDELVALHWPL